MTASRAQAALRGTTAGVRPIGLDELNATAALTSRVDRKFLVPTDVAIEALAPLAADGARILQIDGRRMFGYRSVYYDTADLWTFRAHRQNRRRRAKIRIRDYVDSGLSFLEVKLNGSRDDTDKHRIAHPGTMTQWGRDFVDQVVTSAYGSGPPTALAPSLRVDYSRVTLLTADGSSRVTCDVDLAWRRPDGSGVRSRDDLVLIEVKTPMDRPLRLTGLPRPESGLSKYCVGVTALYPKTPGNPWYRTVRYMSVPEGAHARPATATLLGGSAAR
ncbi:MAG: polyphosphate polymerase domain-containing protein [Stackebrandtia sp.]